MNTETQLIIDQLKRTQKSNDDMRDEFVNVTRELSGLSNETRNLTRRTKYLEEQFAELRSGCVKHGEQSVQFDLEIEQLKAEQERAEKVREKIDLSTLEGWKRIMPYVILGIAGFMGLLKDKVLALINLLFG